MLSYYYFFYPKLILSGSIGANWENHEVEAAKLFFKKDALGKG